MSIFGDIKRWLFGKGKAVAKQTAGEIADKAAAKVHDRYDPPEKPRPPKGGKK